MTSGGARRGQFRIESGKYVSDGLKFPTTRTTKDSIDVQCKLFVLDIFTFYIVLPSKARRKAAILRAHFFSSKKWHSCYSCCSSGRPQANISEAQLLIKPPSPSPTSLVCGSNSNLAKQ